MSEVLKVVFLAFTQPCIQSTLTHVGGVEGLCTLYIVASCPCQEAALLSFLDLSTTRVIADKMHSQYPVLNTKGHSQTW